MNTQGKKRCHSQEAGRTLKEHLACCKLGLQLFEDLLAYGDKTLGNIMMVSVILHNMTTKDERIAHMDYEYDYVRTTVRPHSNPNRL